MSEFLSVQADTADLLAALTAMPEVVAVFAKRAALVTGNRIAHEMKARIVRRTGATGDAITVEELHDGSGYIVFVGDGRQHIASFLEFGTKHMTKRDFFFAAARLEEGPHARRIEDAVQAAIDSRGLGD
jgi:HK97 gp10 family phage protein